jgi:hypothetical protein
MWRVVIILVGVVALDVILLVVGAPELDWNMGEISKALRMRDENPSLETQRALIAALDRGARMSGNARLGFGVAIVLVTNGGLFIAGFMAGQRRWQAKASSGC